MNDSDSAEWRLTAILDRIDPAILDLDPDSTRLEASGWTCLVVHARDRAGRHWIVRQARDGRTERRFTTEAAVLRRISGRIGTRVPQWTDLASGLVAYPVIAGGPAAVEDPRTLVFRWAFDPVRAHRYIRQLAATMARIHAFDTPVTMRSATPSASRTAGLSVLRSLHATDLPMSWRRTLTAGFEDDSLWAWTPRLVHGDLHPGHTITDADHSLAGIIDWTDAAIDDPARDFAYLAWADPGGLLPRILSAYRRASPDRADPVFANRVALHADLLVIELLVRGRSADQPTLSKAALRRLQRPPLSSILFPR